MSSSLQTCILGGEISYRNKLVDVVFSSLDPTLCKMTLQ